MSRAGGAEVTDERRSETGTVGDRVSEATRDLRRRVGANVARSGAALDRLITERDPGWLTRPARVAVRPFFSLLYNAHVTGAENVPRSGPVILSANHRSFFDTPALMLACPRPVVFLGKAEYMDHWKTRYSFPALGMVPIRRDVARASMAALETATGLLADGSVVGIYPEGTRSRDGLLHRGQSGVAHLALKSGAPVVPVGLTGTEEIQPIGAGVPRLRGRLTVAFGEPIDPQEYRSGGGRRRRRHITRDVMAAIAELSDQEQSPDFSDGPAPLIRGGSEAVYRVIDVGASAGGWADAARLAVADTCRSYADARVGEVRGLRCRVDAGGDVQFETDLSVSVKFRGGDR
jgi:1-acyl-sn-glycerol-3-phosphate acyltransferase